MGDLSNLNLLNWRTVMMAMVCLPIIVCAMVLLIRKMEKPATRYLGLFLIAAVLAVGPQIIGYANFYGVWPGLTYFTPFSTELWLGPLIYLHADQLIRGGPLGWRKFLLVPGIVQTLYYSWAYLGLGDYQSKWDYNGDIHQPYILPIENILTIGLFLFAMIAIWRLVIDYREHLETSHSAALDFDPVWLRNLIIGLSMAGIVFIGLETISTLADVSYDAAFPFQVLIMVFVAWIAIDACWRLTKPFPKLSSLTFSKTPETQPDRKDWGDEAQALKTRIDSEAWYLEPGLSIREVASRMGSNESYVSRALNQGLSQSFNQFINGLRIEHARKLIREGQSSMLNIAFDSGFNSKATFNRVFKNHTGQTPSQFKSSQNP